ncbi:MAG: ATP-binding protein [Aggregatilineales bacterium]
MEAVVYQQDKLSALGKMAAGLAHELNNPASAARRASQHLPEYLVRLQKLALKFGGSGLTDSQVEGISAFYAALCGKPGEITEDALAISDREDALTTWLVQQGIAEGAEFAPMLARHSVTDDELERLRDLVGASQLLNVLAWVDGLFNLHVLIGTVDRGTARISDLIKAFKAYSYMDQAPEQEVDVHDGIESTLTIFAHRLKSVTLRREYDRTLPRITAYGGELNQVWTNLLDNALDAMGDAGTLTIRTGRDNEWLVVEVGDTGGGIPPEVQARIFEPFFTTKPLGQGTGLGLDIAYRIITERHHGHIEFNTSPAGTTFRVCLPIES